MVESCLSSKPISHPYKIKSGAPWQLMPFGLVKPGRHVHVKPFGAVVTLLHTELLPQGRASQGLTACPWLLSCSGTVARILQARFFGGGLANGLAGCCAKRTVVTFIAQLAPPQIFSSDWHGLLAVVDGRAYAFWASKR
jgi:hypothetical protein